MVLEAGDDFLLVADAYSPSGLGLPAAVAGEEEICGLLVRKANENKRVRELRPYRLSS